MLLMPHLDQVQQYFRGNMQSTCKSCHEKLTKSNGKDIAIKCSKCQSWQNWRRHLDLIALILGVVVSIAIIVGTIVIPLVEMFSSKHASMKMTVVSSSDNEMNILLANVGELPAGINFCLYSWLF